MASMLMVPVSCSSRLRRGYTPSFSGNGVANSHKANMPPKNMAKVNLMFFMVVFLMDGNMKRSAPFVGIVSGEN